MSKVRIGSEYRRPWFRDWTATSSSSLLGPLDKDEVRIQTALLNHHNRERLAVEARYARRAWLGYAAVLGVCLYLGVMR